MKKIAIFVEGQTELELTCKLLIEIAGKRKIALEIKEQHRGVLNFIELRSNTNNNSNPEIYILLVNCNTDNQVKSQIAEQHASLTASGYTKIIGLRDVFPFQHSDIPRIDSLMSAGLPTGGASIVIILAILEIEAWFIDEHTHYINIHPEMTIDEIKSRGVDLASTPGDSISNPADTLNQIYSYWGLAYKKTRKHVERTLKAISFEELYITVRSKASSLDKYISELESEI